MIASFPSGPLATNAFVVHSGEAAAIIDPAPGSFDSINTYVQAHNLKVEKILLTHSHWDHIADCAKCKQAFNAPVYVHPIDAENLKNPGSDGLPLPLPIEPVEPDGFLSDGDKIPLGSRTLEVIHTPGHCPGSVCFYFPGHLIGGDLIFKRGIGRLDLPTGEPQKMEASLKKIAALPPETIIYPGHGGETTIGEELWEYL